MPVKNFNAKEMNYQTNGNTVHQRSSISDAPQFRQMTFDFFKDPIRITIKEDVKENTRQAATAGQKKRNLKP